MNWDTRTRMIVNFVGAEETCSQTKTAHERTSKPSIRVRLLAGSPKQDEAQLPWIRPLRCPRPTWNVEDNRGRLLPATPYFQACQDR